MTSLTFTSGNGAVWPLNGTTGVTLTEGAEGLFELPVELNMEQRVAFDGGVVYRARFAPRRMVLPLLIVAQGGKALHIWRALMRDLRTPKGSLIYTDPDNI